MSSEWRRTTIEEIAADESSSISIGPFGSRMKSDCYVDSGVPVVRGNNISGGKYPEGDFVFITEEKASELKSSQVRYGDLVFPHRGAIGRVALIPENGRMILSSSLMKLTPSREKCCPAFLLYFFRSRKGVQELLKNASTVGTPGIGQPLTSLKQISLDLPPLKEQKSIAHILGTLDEKIELNRKTNETLEAMAKALFKSWFVDFDPVRAKAEGRPTGLPAEISDLFPDSFEDSELGEIPSGWAVTTVGEVTDLVTKGTTPTSIGGAFSSEGIPFYKVESISDEGHIIPGKCAFIDDKSDALLARSRIEEGDILFSIAGTIGRVAQMTRFDIPANTNQALAIARPSNRRISSTLLFYFLRERGRIDLALSRTVQSVQANFSLSELKSIPLPLPQQSSRIALEDIFDSLRKKISSNQRNSFSISALRDTLLPKLISGEIRIPDAEKMLEEVGV